MLMNNERGEREREKRLWRWENEEPPCSVFVAMVFSGLGTWVEE